jgi:hypothetical protein
LFRDIIDRLLLVLLAVFKVIATFWVIGIGELFRQKSQKGGGIGHCNGDIIWLLI